MTDKPKIYATCPAGCLWETIHKSDFEKSAAYIPIKIKDEGNFILDKGKTYRINTLKNETGELFASWGFNICISVWWETSSPQYHEEIVTLPAFDKYSQSVKFRLHAVESPISDVVPFISCYYDLNGERKSFAIQADTSARNIGVSVSVEPTVNAQVEVLLMNEDAQTKAVDGKTAYEYAKDGGYEGTEEDFARDMMVKLTATTAYEFARKGGYAGTEAEFAEDINPDNIKAIVAQDIIAQLQGLPVFGVVDENKKIKLTTLLPNGKYEMGYENEDGSFTEIVAFTIGEVVIVNLLESALTPNDITTVFDGKGYKNGYYASAAEPFYNTDANFFCTGLMSIPEGRTFYIKGCTIDTSLSHTRFGLMTEDGKLINTANLSSWSASGVTITVSKLAEQYYSVNLGDTSALTNTPYYFYLSASGTGDNVIVSATPIE